MQLESAASVTEPDKAKAPAAGALLTSNADLYRPQRKEEEPRYVDRRCITIDPNWRRAPVMRVRAPRESQKRRAKDWDKRRFTLPRLTMEGLRTLAIELAQQQRSSEWPREAARYPLSLNYFVIAALNDFLEKMGFPEFRVEEAEQVPGRVRRFVAR